ncbi:hypothetical protein [Allocoleopsis franciscana]|uniref:hypothetical protein n=1 Tax=Allocoleopsis franciscana TaxID=2886352 RepID=UPI0002DE5268|nr:hypothetical protein [Allocoleopsis franciscana]
MKTATLGEYPVQSTHLGGHTKLIGEANLYYTQKLPFLIGMVLEKTIQAARVADPS